MNSPGTTTVGSGGAGSISDSTTTYEPHQLDESLLEPWNYLNQYPGKNIRGTLINAFNVWVGLPQETLSVITKIVGDLHAASLLIDDIEDNSKLRRGVPVAHEIFGIPSTINCANYAYFVALEQCHMLNSPEAMSVFVGELLNLHRGQGQDILWRDGQVCPTEEQYYKMVLDKTGGLFRLAVRLMQAVCTTKEGREMDFVPLVDKLALYFQIRDDYVNLSSASYMQNKSFCEDLTEGKFSFPVIHCVRSRPKDTRLLHILKQRTDDVNIKMHALQWMRETNSLDYTREKVRALKGEVLTEIENLGGHAVLVGLVEKLDQQLGEGDDAISAPPRQRATSGSGPPPLPPSPQVVDGL